MQASSADERARLLRGTKAPSGWDAANFLVAEASTALCLIHVNDADSDKGWCNAFEHRKESNVQIELLEGMGEFILTEVVLQEPIVPVLTDSDFAAVADLPSAGTSSATTPSRTGGTQCWECVSTLSWRESSSRQQGRTACLRCRLRAGLLATC